MSRFHIIAANNDDIPPVSFEIEAQNIASAIVIALQRAALATADNVALVAYQFPEDISLEIIEEEL